MPEASFPFTGTANANPARLARIRGQRYCERRQSMAALLITMQPLTCDSGPGDPLNNGSHCFGCDEEHSYNFRGLTAWTGRRR